MIREEQYHVCQIVFFWKMMSANASDIVSTDFAEIQPCSVGLGETA